MHRLTGGCSRDQTLRMLGSADPSATTAHVGQPISRSTGYGNAGRTTARRWRPGGRSGCRLLQVLGQHVAVEVRAELPAFGVRNPRQAVRPGRLDRGLGALVQVGECPDEHHHGVGNGRLFPGGSGPVGQIQLNTFRQANDCHVLAGSQLELVGEIHRHGIPEAPPPVGAYLFRPLPLPRRESFISAVKAQLEGPATSA